MDEQREGSLSTADLAGRTNPAREQVRVEADDPDGRANDRPSAEASTFREEVMPPQAGAPAAPAREGPAVAEGAGEPLFSQDEAGRFRGRWTDVQALFVDEPRRAVEEADELVAEVIQRLAGFFADERQQLETRWSGGGDASTEDLRQALRRYRSFFDRLLSV